MSVTDDRPKLPPVKCAPWCVDQDGHPGALFLADQRCGSVELKALQLILGQVEDAA